VLVASALRLSEWLVTDRAEVTDARSEAESAGVEVAYQTVESEAVFVCQFTFALVLATELEERAEIERFAVVKR